MARELAVLLALTVAIGLTKTDSPKQVVRQTATSPACSAMSDVVFVVDSSNAVGATSYQHELDFIRQTMHHWDVGPTGVQVGMVTYGESARSVFNLNTYQRAQDIRTALTSAPAVGGSANLQEALRFATDNMFTPQSGVRAQSSKVIIFVTNGHSQNRDLTILQSQTAQNNDIQVYSVGIGAGIDERELMGVASDPDTRYFYEADTFESLSSVADIIGPKICNEVPEDPAFLPPPTGCLQKADVVFLLDSSSSIGKDNFHKIEDFLKDVTEELAISPEGVHVGLMQYSSYPSLEFPLNMYTTRYDVLKAIDGVSYMGGGANTADALQYMRQQMFSQNSGARPGVPRIGIVITDGSSSNSGEVAIQADNARLDNIGLISVGVGPNMNTAELQSIADDPDASHMFTVSDFNELHTITSSLIDAMCTVDTTAPVMTEVSGGTLPPDPCQDFIDNCENYGIEVCTQYVEWSKINCQRYCGICQPLYTTAPPACNDRLPNCNSFGVGSCTGVYVGWAQENCRRYCGYCGPETETLGYYGQCFYKGKTYATGQKWLDGCDYECVCEDGNSGKYRCFNRCPIYHNLPSQCTLVKDPEQCCLQPRCYLNQQVNTIQGSTIGNVNGIKTCVYKQMNYYQNQIWQDGCDYLCTCTDSSTGHYECHDLCPTYSDMPSYCRLDKEAGSCCAKPVCEFEMQQGIFSGAGTVSGNGIDNPPPSPPPCVDVIDNCAMYGKPACADYGAWALQNCRSFCEMCDDAKEPGPEDVCIYDGQLYSQDATWSVSCSVQCRCERAQQGYYRCVDSCPTYTNIPPTCRMVSIETECCPVLQCPSGTFITSTNNYYAIGNGGNIYTGSTYIQPTLTSGAVAQPGTGGSMFQAPAITGCLYNGEVYVQGQKWDDGCDRSCECTDASTGHFQCRARCPTYINLPRGCQLVIDETDTCCTKPLCTGEAAGYTAIPVYGQYQSQIGSVQPPPNSERYTGTGSIFGSGSYVISGSGGTVVPTAPGFDFTGGIGYCSYQGHTYLQDDTWQIGCDANCVCDNANIGHYTCIERCVKYPNVPEPWCHLEQDPENACCQKPVCNWDLPTAKVTGLGALEPSTVTSSFNTPVATPGFAFCVYNGTHYDRNQIWFQGCEYKCTCEDPNTNNYRCVSRCPEYENLDPSCTFEPDPMDPGCCSVPRCLPPSLQSTLVPNPTQGAITVTPGFVTGDNFPPGATGGPNLGYCEYNGERYQQGERWEDGCQYNCVCEDTISGKYKCTQKCTRYDYIPPNCRLVSDFTNPCCRVLRCDQIIATTLAPGATPPPTPSPNAFCVYKGVNYRQSETWMDGCEQSCRCDNAETGVYTCTQRCMTYASLPPECKMVTDPDDQCCLVPQCGIPNLVTTIAPLPGGPTTTQSPDLPPGYTPTQTTPVPSLYPTPTAVPGMVTGAAQHPTPTVGPNGETEAPRIITVCEYKGVQYQQGQQWQDGCQFLCECVNALQGKYECTERCARYTNLPAECRLVKNPGDPCCEVPECGPTPAPTTSAPILGSTITPIPVPGGTTVSPVIQSTSSPVPTSPKSVCVYKGKSYSQGQRWYDGCDYQCVCENEVQGLYTCNDRCPVYQSALPEGCTLVQDPKDPFCCRTPQCDFPSNTNGTSGFLFPTPPLAIVSGGSATPVPTLPGATQSPTVGQFISPLPGQTTQTPAPTLPSNVCVYNGRTYQQGQTWRDGCNYNCLCDDAMHGHYVCTEICPKNPPSLPAECWLVRDTSNPCCMIPYCDFSSTTTSQPPPPPTGTILPGQTTPEPPPIIIIPTSTPPPESLCVYNGVTFRQGQTWDDGCDLRCECENAATGYYRCNQRCPRYDSVPAGCTLVTDPRDSCCRVPQCEPVFSTSATSPSGSTLNPPSPGSTLQPGATTPVPMLIPTAIPGKIEGVGVTPTVGTTAKPDPNNPFPTYAPTTAPGCLYRGVMYRQGQTWSDGCQYSCVCVDEVTGRYTCTEKCPLYPSIPPNCQLVNDPNDPCCKVPQCLPNPTLAPTNPPVTGPTLNPPAETSPPAPGATTPAPQLRDVCRYMGKEYTQGQQWNDGCDKVCVCEDSKTGFYRCTDRCVQYATIPNGCTMVADPNDPVCCQVPQCAPTPNPSFPSPTSGPTEPVTVPLGIVTGLGPVPSPTTARPGDTTQPPQPGCVYKGVVYRQSQRWQDGCEFTCVCVDEMAGMYQCTQRCPTFGQLQSRCTLEPDPADFCCMRQVCDFSQTTPAPYIPPPPTAATTPLPLGQTTATLPPGQIPQTSTPRPTPPSTYFCVYNGVTYSQGVTWNEGCVRTCRCENALDNIYTCYDRCPTYQLQSGCHLVTNPQDPCCQVPECTVMVTPAPTNPTPYPNGSYPNPDLLPSKAPGLLPEISPVPVPTAIPGIKTGTLATPTGYCEYKGMQYRTGQAWADGCDYNCVCVDDTTGQYRCTERCPPYPSLPSYCVLVGDPNDQCCETPYCPGLVSPTTPIPLTSTPAPPVTPLITGTGPTQTTPPPSVTFAPPTAAPTWFPTFSGPIPSSNSNPVPPDTCNYMGKAYTQGQQWYDGCTLICVCEDGKTGFYRCRERCPSYVNIGPNCMMVPDSNDPVCCKVPMCDQPTNPDTPPDGVFGVVQGNALPPTPRPVIAPSGTPTDQPLTTPLQNVCVYQGNAYTQGQRWQDGCELQCECVDGMTGQYRCTDRCPRYPNLPTTCVMTYDPTDPCCMKPLCGSNVPTPPPTPPPTVGPNGETVPPPPSTPNPSYFCVYNGVPYRQGQSWNVDCDKVCTCEDAMNRRIGCRDRCPKYPSIADGCQLTTDPMDACCQILDCPPQLVPNTQILVPPVQGVLSGGLQPQINGAPGSFGSGPRDVCVYNGQTYTQGQTWDDGCTYSCVCVDAYEGKYMCTEKCPRYNNLQATCTLVQDQKDPCCKIAICPDLHPPSTTIPQVTPVLLPGQTTPPPQLTPQAPASSPIPRDVCIMNNQYYKEGQMWFDGCELQCRCDDADNNFYRCSDRCSKYNGVPAECTMIPDPRDPMCCKIPSCPEPTQGPNPTTGYVRPTVRVPISYVTGEAPIPSPTPTRYAGQTTVQPIVGTGCYYKNQVYQAGQSWDDGCDYTCECLDDLTGAYRCNDKCTPPASLPDLDRCRLVQDPQNPCCSVPYCDYTNPEPVFPTPITPTGPGGDLYFYTQPTPLSGSRKPGFCVYQGVYYRQDEEWEIGCTQRCRCENTDYGFYSCFERCKTYDNLGSSCTLKTDPADPCCVIPDCNIYPTPGLEQTTGPNGETPAPVPVQPVQTAVGSFTGTGGSGPIRNNPIGSNFGMGDSLQCIYKGVAYTQGQVWQDGCLYRCECIDAVRGQYRCSDRCPSYNFLPPDCNYGTDPRDACCQIVSCTGTLPPISLTTSPTVINTPAAIIGHCVYTDGQQYNTGDAWSDGCSLNCRCVDGARNVYTCTGRCPVYSSIPDYCHLAHDPRDPCCQVVQCSGQLVALPGSNNPTASPTLAPDILNILPLGTHVLVSGRSPMTPEYTGPAVTGGRSACVYKNVAYRQGEAWDDGCDYACRCNDEITGEYTCTSKCPNMPPLPAYCTKVTIPGQCCSSLTCEVPNHGLYSPLPEITANILPTEQPDTGHGTTANPQILVVASNPILTGNSLPGAGAPVPPGTNTGSLEGKCITEDNLMYNPGEKWSIACDYDCECLDGWSGYYSCLPKCSEYSNLPPECSLASTNNGCCLSPICSNTDGTTVDLGQNPNMTLLFPMTVIKTGGYTGFRPGYLTGVANSWTGSIQAECLYKGVGYPQGATWDDGCEFTCTCEDAVRHQFLCKPKCTRYLSIPSTCNLVKEPQGCCELLDCTQDVITITTTTNPACRDSLENCVDYGESVCGGIYEPWARRNCEYYCGFMTCGATATPGLCQDKLDNCPDYTQDACVGEYIPWAQENCPLFCNLCPEQLTTSSPSDAACHDLLTDCRSYGDYSCKPPYTEWARKNCNSTCGFCHMAVGIGIGGISGNSSSVGGVVVGGSTEIGSNSQPGWVTLMKGVSGVPNDDLYRLWASSETRNQDNAQAMAPTADFPGHYKPALSNYWESCNFDQVKVAIWNEGQEKAYIIFDAQGTNKMNWFDPSRIISSSYTDLRTSTFNHFSLQGDTSMGREFYISKQSSGCDGSGWIMISTQDTCFYERNAAAQPAFFYSRGTTAGPWSTRLEGDVFLISAHGGNCGNTTSTRPVCTYTDGREFRTGETWQDGCEKNCTCRDGNLGYYQCDDLCRQYQTPLPQGCSLITNPGECCATLDCHITSNGGCYYKGSFYSQGEVWDDGCDYVCTCETASRGFYTCRTRCLTWNLPAECYLASAPQGKCCPVPVCPPGILINYPPGYTQE